MPNINLESLRPYHVESTSSRLITEVKQHWALWVLGWVTTWEHRVLKTFLLIFCIYLRQFVTRGWEEWNVSAGLSKRPSKYSLIHFYKRCVSWDYVESNTGSPFFTGAKKLHYWRPNNQLIKSIIFIFFLRIFFLHFCQNS